MKIKKLTAALVCICMAAGLLSVAASAAGNRAMQRVDSAYNPTGGIRGCDSPYPHDTVSYHYVYYGETNSAPIKWRVLDDQTNMGTPGLFLLSEELVGTTVFNSNSGAPSANVWAGSGAQSWCAAFLTNNMDAGEQSAVLPTSKNDPEDISRSGIWFGASALVNDRVFFLSVKEVENYAYGFSGNVRRVAYLNGVPMPWWLRNPEKNNMNCAASPQGVLPPDEQGEHTGIVIGRTVDLSNTGARPALNLDLDQVLFTSAATGGKAGAVGALAQVPAASPTEWKLTLKDGSRNTLAVTGEEKIGSTLRVSYTGAKTGPNEYLSAIIQTFAGDITYYGRIASTADASAASGTAAIDLSGVTTEPSDRLYIFSEQYNGGDGDVSKETDYAGDLIEVASHDYLLSASPAELSFGTAAIGYAAPSAQTVTVRNMGVYPVTLTQPTSENYNLGPLSATALASGESATFTAAPKTGLFAGNYSENITVTGTNGTNAAVRTSFTVYDNTRDSDSADRYTLTFETNGGNPVSPVIRSDFAPVDLTLSQYLPVRSGYKFAGWYSEKALTNQIKSVLLKKNTTVYAKWNIRFNDVTKSDWFDEGVDYVSEHGLMNGTGNGAFSPHSPLSRGMLVTILYRMAGSPAVTEPGAPFSDVAADSFYADGVYWAQSNGIVNGFHEKKFGPGIPVTRAQMAAILYRYAVFAGCDVTEGGMAIREFDDYARIPPYAAQAMSWCVNTGLLQGDGNQLNPAGTTSRAQAAVILMRFCKGLEK